MVPRLRAGRRLALLGCVAAELVLVAAVAATQKTDGTLSVVAALVLAPVAVAAAAALGRRVAGERFALLAAACYVAAPLLGNRYMLPGYRGTFDARALPALVGLQRTGAFALGVAIALVAWAAVSLAPRVAAAAGIAAAAAALALYGGSLGDLVPALHETVWSVALLEWIVVAGLVGALAAEALPAAAVGGWLVAAIAWAAHRGYDDVVFWRSLAVAAPAAAVTLASIALLAPRLRRGSRPAAEATHR